MCDQPKFTCNFNDPCGFKGVCIKIDIDQDTVLKVFKMLSELFVKEMTEREKVLEKSREKVVNNIFDMMELERTMKDMNFKGRKFEPKTETESGKKEEETEDKIEEKENDKKEEKREEKEEKKEEKKEENTQNNYAELMQEFFKLTVDPNAKSTDYIPLVTKLLLAPTPSIFSQLGGSGGSVEHSKTSGSSSTRSDFPEPPHDQ